MSKGLLLKPKLGVHIMDIVAKEVVGISAEQLAEVGLLVGEVTRWVELTTTAHIAPHHPKADVVFGYRKLLQKRASCG
jgi:hypothetical protein